MYLIQLIIALIIIFLFCRVCYRIMSLIGNRLHLAELFYALFRFLKQKFHQIFK